MFEVSYNADAYERGRPDYPEPAVEHLLRSLRIGGGDTVLDLAAGTGKFTRHLVGVAAEVVAVEPEPSMRAELTRRFPDVDVRDGEGASIPLPEDSVDAVTVAQAFHWFAGIDALREIARILRPGGRLGLIWNVRDLSTPLQQALEDIYVKYRLGSPNYRGSGWQDVFTPDCPFGPLHHDEFPCLHPVDRATLLDLVMSMSYMSLISEADAADVRAQVGVVFDEHAGDGDEPVVVVPYRTNVFWAEVERGS